MFDQRCPWQFQATYVLLQEQLSIMDVNDYTTLACEQYVKSFTIDNVF